MVYFDSSYLQTYFYDKITQTFFFTKTKLPRRASNKIFSKLLLVTFVVCGFTFPTEENNNAFSSAVISDNNGNQMKFLEEKILNGVDSSAYLCEDPYTVLCGKDVNHTKPSYLKQSYRHIRDHLIEHLSHPVGKNEVHAISVEKALFQKCMNLGSKKDTENTFATMNFVSDLFQQVLDYDQVWQNMDAGLNLRGFGFTFFDIGVERDPENPKQNIITLQPPSYSQIENIIELIFAAFDATNYQHISKSLAWKFYDSIDHEAVRQFFNHWSKVFLHAITQRKHADVKNAKMTISEWNSEYNARTFHRITSKIDWEKLIIENFHRANVPVTGRENIIIKNKDYFLYLIDVLGSVSNDVIVSAIKTKVIAENLRYIDWNNAHILIHKKQSLFCFEDTKLYGASFRLLRDLKKEDSSNAPNYEILKVMLHNIASVTESAIDGSNNLSPKEKTYLKSEVKLITSDIVNYNKYRPTVDNYYQNYEVSPSYFVSILKYRKMLKDKELSSLTSYSDSLTETIPFSVTDLTKPRNRFILNVFANSFLLSKQPIPSGLQKEVHYGAYGVKIASFLYGLLNENRFDDGVIVHGGQVNWYDHPDYPAKSLQCFVGSDLRSYGRGLASETVTQIFGAHIAYKAMLKDYLESHVERQHEYALRSSDARLTVYTADQLFFMAYGKYNCELSKKVLDTVLSNLNEYNYAFKCNLSPEKIQSHCSLKAFEIQEKQHFINMSL